MARKQTNYERKIKPRLDEIKEWIEAGVMIKDIVRALDVGMTSYHNYIHTYPEFKEIMSRSKDFRGKIPEKDIYLEKIPVDPEHEITSYDTNVKPRFKEIEEWLANGVSINELQRKLKIGSASFYRYRDQYPEFAELLIKYDKKCKGCAYRGAALIVPEKSRVKKEDKKNVQANNELDDCYDALFRMACGGHEVYQAKTVTVADKDGNVKGTKTIQKKWVAIPNLDAIQLILDNPVFSRKLSAKKEKEKSCGDDCNCGTSANASMTDKQKHDILQAVREVVSEAVEPIEKRISEVETKVELSEEIDEFAKEIADDFDFEDDE